MYYDDRGGSQAYGDTQESLKMFVTRKSFSEESTLPAVTIKVLFNASFA